jgi:hypothetical protein
VRGSYGTLAPCPEALSPIAGLVVQRRDDLLEAGLTRPTLAKPPECPTGKHSGKVSHERATSSDQPHPMAAFVFHTFPPSYFT